MNTVWTRRAPRPNIGHGYPGAVSRHSSRLCSGVLAKPRAARENYTDPSPLCTRRQLSSGRVLLSFTERFKDAVRAFTPKEMLETEEGDQSEDTQPRTTVLPGKYNQKYVIAHGLTGSYTKLPQHLIQLVEAINVPSDRLLALIETQELPIEVLQVLYRPLVGMLDERCTLKFAMELYIKGKYKESLDVVLENLALGETLTTLEAMMDKLALDAIDTREFLLSHIAGGLIARGHANTATQLMHDSDPRFVKECELQLMLTHAESSNDVLVILRSSDLPPHPTISAYIPHLSLPMQVAILQALIRFDEIDAFAQLCTADLIKQPGVLRSMVRSFARSSYHGMTPQSKAFDVFFSLVCESFTPCSSSVETDNLQPTLIAYPPAMFFTSHDLRSIPQLGHNQLACKRLWKTYLDFLDFQETHEKGTFAFFFLGNFLLILLTITELDTLPSHDTKSRINNKVDTLRAFLHQSLLLELTYTNVHILSIARGSISDIPLLGAVLRQSVWGQKRPETPDASIYNNFTTSQPNDLTTLKAILPENLFLQAAVWCLKKTNLQLGLTQFCIALKSNGAKPTIQETAPFPGTLLWKLLSVFQDVETLDQDFLLQVATSIASRPPLEQLKYYTMSFVMSSGLKQATKATIELMGSESLQSHLGNQEKDAYEKLIVCGMVLANDKLQNANISKTLFAQLASANSIDTAMVTLFTLLKDTGDDSLISIDSDFAKNVLRSIIKQGQFNSALRVADIVSSLKLCNFTPLKETPSYDIPLVVYYWLLVDSSQHDPVFCHKLYKFLKSQKYSIPSWTVRDMATGYAKSPHLTQGQRAKRVGGMFRVLKSRGEPLGTESTTAFVESLLTHAKEAPMDLPGMGAGPGPRQRLKWAISLAKEEHVSEIVMQRWFMELAEMKHGGKGFFN